MRRCLLLWLLTAWLLADAPAAWAHAVLLDSVPPDGARLESPPAEVTLRFNEPVTPVSVRVLGPGGRALVLPGPPAGGDGVLRIPLPAGLDPGTHVVSYRVASGDGHPVAGSLLFGVGAVPDASAMGAAKGKEQGRDAVILAALAVRAIHYGSLLAAAGGGLFLALVLGRWSPVNRRLKPGLCLCVGAAALAAVLNVGFAGVLLEGAPASALADASAWRAGAASATGLSGAVALLGLLAVALGLVLDGAPEGRGAAGTVLLTGGAVGTALALAATGHAATAEPPWLSVPLVALHGLGAAFWIGSLWPLAVVLRTEAPESALRIVRRFSGWALAAVGLLLAAGAGLSLLQLADPRAVLDTAYGQIWLGKIVCVAVLLGLAALNRLRLTPALSYAGTAAAARLRGSVFTEMAVAALILLFTAALGAIPPPRARVEAAESLRGRPAGHTATVATQGWQAVISVTPARPGRNRVEVRVARPDGTPAPALETEIRFALPAAGIEPIVRALPPAGGPGMFAADGVELPLAGVWAVGLDVLVSDFEKALFRTELPVAEGR